MNHTNVLRTAVFTTVIAILTACGSDRDSTALVSSPNGAASLSGIATVGEAVTASVSDTDGVEAGSESYQWFANGEEIPGATSSSYTLTAEEGGDDVTVIIRYTDSAGLRETVESSAMTVQAAFNLGLVYVHGPVDQAACALFAVDSAGQASSAEMASSTTSAGSLSFGSLIPLDGTALISCTGGTYISEATGLEVNAPDSRAVVTVDSDTIFTVSPLTEIATQLAEANGDLNTAITTFNPAMATRVGIEGNITEIEPTDLMSSAATDDGLTLTIRLPPLQTSSLCSAAIWQTTALSLNHY